MIVTVASFKGGVGKTTSAVHLAAYFAKLDKTVLIDGDPNRSSTAWAARGALPFDVADEAMTAKVARAYEHLVFDTAARPDPDVLRVLAEGCDMLVIPTTADGLSFDALMLTVAALQKIDAAKYRILVTMAPPRPARDGDIAREALAAQGLPVFGTTVRALKAFKTAGTEGVVVSGVKDPRANLGWWDYVAVCDELVTLVEGVRYGQAG
ncbi:ParA family protein [Paludisphaera mucosa]|uniref:ParA family protein n=1 Tax=Paludisphaera mucosa TaxID=3030827 RepID=A0ABT6FLW7_9BACT|nr:ParA family protein [Paludisphaera mucosa]MDG3008519.1 ParA family protein [Paludisphaera mucosa]